MRGSWMKTSLRVLSIPVVAYWLLYIRTTIQHAGVRSATNQGYLAIIRAQNRTKGPIHVVDVSNISLKDIESRLSFILPGGAQSNCASSGADQSNCSSTGPVAILVPYRGRATHLKTFLSHFHPFLTRQQLDYRIFIAEHSDTGDLFNKGATFNAGFLEIQKRFPGYFQCVVLQDVDMYPEDDRISYACDAHAWHLGAHVDRWGYRVLYTSLVGGAFKISVADFNRTNGFTNMFEGWGGEDDDFYGRLTASKIKFLRYPNWAHWKNPNHVRGPRRQRKWNIYKDAGRRMPFDGLSTVNYTLLAYREHPLYTNITIKLHRQTVANRTLETTKQH